MDDTTFLNLVTFWRDIEALTPQTIPKTAPGDKEKPSSDWSPDIQAPWQDEDFKLRKIELTHAWRHTIYAAVYNLPRFIELLEITLGKQPDVFEEPPDGKSCVFSIAIDEHGRPLVETMMISMAAWAFGIVRSQGLGAISGPEACDTSGLHAPQDNLETLPSYSGFRDFDIQLTHLREDLAFRHGTLPDGEPIDLTWFNDFVSAVINRLNLDELFSLAPTHRVKSSQIRRPRNEGDDPNTPPKSDVDLLNSFFIKDLNRVINGRLARAGDGMRRYLEPPAELLRIDVRKNRGEGLDSLNPANFPEGCWPAEHPLVWSQQVAINAMWKELRTGGCFAVNGPPGTGKTTLLRDVVSAIVVERAKILAAQGAGLLGEKRTIDVGEREIPYYELKPAVAGYAIVVASSNNGAVENISLELPKEDAIHGIWSRHVDAYSDIAGELLGDKQKAWAMIAGRLGNKSNRSDFAKKFWWQKGDQTTPTPAGLRERLQAITSRKARPAIPWKDAVGKFNSATEKEQRWRKRITEMAKLPRTIEDLNVERCQTEKDHGQKVSCHDEVTKLINGLDESIKRAEREVVRLDSDYDRCRSTKPGFLEWLATFGKSHRKWRADLDAASKKLNSAEADRDALLRDHSTYEAKRKEIGDKIEKFKHSLDGIAVSLKAKESELAGAREELDSYWPDLDAKDHDRERSSPWAHPDWRDARIRVFLAAMDLHRAFIEESADKMTANLNLAMKMLQGGIPDPKVRAVALDSLALACPVISTTFASASTLFEDLGPGSIGWLLIDEAGQATPQAAAGAIWRARRVVVVGDPLQLEPVVTLPRTIEASLAACHGGVDNRWHPSRTSVQMLADQTTPIGTTVGDGDEAIWVGAPLRVHRRCDDPMFSISNAVAYDGLMVHQKKPSSAPWPASAWLDVPRGQANGNWFPDEGDALRRLLEGLLHTHKVPARDIYLISPFRQVVGELKKIGEEGKYKLDPHRVGTVHTTQGKEADVVIMVLGGGTAGARDWAASKPNLLNVAASRAKARLYVIGDRADWAKRKYFDVLDRELK